MCYTGGASDRTTPMARLGLTHTRLCVRHAPRWHTVLQYSTQKQPLHHLRGPARPHRSHAGWRSTSVTSTQSLQHTASTAPTGDACACPTMNDCKRLGMPSCSLMFRLRSANVDPGGSTHRRSGPAIPYTDTNTPSPTIPLSTAVRNHLIAHVHASHARHHRIPSRKRAVNSMSLSATPHRPITVAFNAKKLMT